MAPENVGAVSVEIQGNGGDTVNREATVLEFANLPGKGEIQPKSAVIPFGGDINEIRKHRDKEGACAPHG